MNKNVILYLRYNLRVKLSDCEIRDAFHIFLSPENSHISLAPSICYRPQRSCGQANVFTGVCLSTGGGGCLPQCMLGCHTPPGSGRAPPPLGPGRPPPPLGPGRPPPGPGRPPLGPGRQPPRDQADPPGPGRPPWDQADTPPDQADTPPPWDQADTPPESRLQHTVYERPVRILLECILVCLMYLVDGHLNRLQEI